jgi:glutathione synthase/RimK-type ligase-like ATP-grasp enzyme
MHAPRPPIVALVSARAAHGLDEDLLPLETALRAAGADARVVDWDDERIEWARFDVAVLRSTWDYATRLAEFLTWADRAARRVELLNPFDVVRWNTDKHYLAALERGGVRIVPSRFVEPGADATAAVARFLADFSMPEVVVKPAVGAGSREAQRHERRRVDAMTDHVRRLLDARHSALLQPYLERVEDSGETALIYFRGRFSHAVRKGPLLRRGAEPTAGLFAAEHIVPRTAPADELLLAERALGAIPFATPLYARVDVIRDDTGAPCVLELELTEPSLFFAHAPGSAERFARAILGACPATRSTGT